MKADILVCDPAWSFSDQLTMSDVKRGASSQYATMTIDKIKQMPVADISADNSLLALWVVGSQLQEGLDVMRSWNFIQKQVFVWVKVKKEPFGKILLSLAGEIKRYMQENNFSDISLKTIKELFIINQNILSLDDTLAFGMGHLARQCHEICLIGVKGNVYKMLQNKSQRSVCFGPVMKHSAKPEDLQDRLDIMFPDQNLIKLELFGRRSRPGWKVFGNESPDTLGEDIFDSIEKFKNA